MVIDVSDDQLKAMAMDKLAKRNCWGVKYLPLDTLVNWLGNSIRRNGKRVKLAIKGLVNESYLLVHKKGDTVSLNPARSREIMDFLKRFFP